MSDLTYRKGEYKGETPVKGVTRVLVWLQHRHLLGATQFKSTPHIFLASRIAGDIDTLRDMGVRSDNIWAVEKDREQYQHLLARRKREQFRLFPQTIELVGMKHPKDFQSVYLDYCGNLSGTAGTTRRIAALLPQGSVLSITLFLGREHVCPEDREAALLGQIRSGTSHQVSVVQSIFYASMDSGNAVGSPMGTWTFFLGPATSKSKMRFDLRRCDTHEVVPHELWQTKRDLATSRSQAAKANRTKAGK